MAAPLGNKFWELRLSHGRSPIFKTPEQIWTACCEYFQWVDDNPLKAEKLFAYQGNIIRGIEHKMRAMTIGGLCIFLGISKQAWGEYRQREGFGDVTTRVEDIIRTQKFEGAAAELFNANIIARDLGLADKQDGNVKMTLEQLVAAANE